MAENTVKAKKKKKKGILTGVLALCHPSNAKAKS